MENKKDEKNEKPTKMVTPADLFGEVRKEAQYDPPEKEEEKEKEPTKH